MAASTAFNHGGPSFQLTNRHRNVGWQALGAAKPKALISSKFGPALMSDELLNIARALCRLDMHVLGLVKRAYDLRLAETSTAGHTEARHGIADIATLLEQFVQVDLGHFSFSELYLKDKHMLSYLRAYLNVISYTMKVDGNNTEQYQFLVGHTRDTIALASALEPLLVDAASRGLLTSDIKLMFGDRWDRFDQIYEIYCLHITTPPPFTKWNDVLGKFRLVTNTETAPSRQIVKASFWTKTTILWLTFFGMALSNIFTFTIGYSHSTHEPGNAADADFWFQLQGCMTQSFALAISCIPLWKDPNLPKWSWVPPMVVALICTVLAPSLYTTLPTEWAAILAAVGAAVQAFLVLQIVLVGE